MTIAKDVTQSIADTTTAINKVTALQTALTNSQNDAAAAQTALATVMADLLDIQNDITPVPVSPPPPPPPPPSPPPPPPPPATGFLYKRALEVITPAYQTNVPALGASWPCPESGATVKRLTDYTKLPGVPSDVTGVVIDYSRFSPESPDRAYLYINGVGGNDNAWLLNTADGSVVRKLKGADGSSLGENNLIRWDASQPKAAFYYVLGMKLYRQDAATATDTLIRDFIADFPGCQQITNGVEGDCSLDGTKWVFMAQVYTGGYWTTPTIFAYDVPTNTILGKYANPITSAENSSPNMVDMVPDGSGVLIDWGVKQGTAADQDGAHVYPLNLDPSKAVKVGHGEEHSGWAMNAAGKWGFVSQDNSTDSIIWCSLTGGYNAADMVVIQNMANFGYKEEGDWHFGKLNVPGWAMLITAHVADAQPGDNQVLYLPVQPNATPLLVSATFNLETGQYYDQCFGAASLDGCRVYWGANYGKRAKGQDVYTTTIPADWATHVGA